MKTHLTGMEGVCLKNLTLACNQEINISMKTNSLFPAVDNSYWRGEGVNPKSPTSQYSDFTAWQRD